MEAACLEDEDFVALVPGESAKQSSKREKRKILQSARNTPVIQCYQLEQIIRTIPDLLTGFPARNTYPLHEACRFVIIRSTRALIEASSACLSWKTGKASELAAVMEGMCDAVPMHVTSCVSRSGLPREGASTDSGPWQRRIKRDARQMQAAARTNWGEQVLIFADFDSGIICPISRCLRTRYSRKGGSCPSSFY